MTTLLNFSDLGLFAPILGALAAEGYTAPTPIQFQAIPPVLGGRDLCGIAQTGTGKTTAAFALPILQRLAAAKQRTASQTCRALVLSPTRELASQIAGSFRAYGAGMPLSTAVVFGGVPIGPQRQKLARDIDKLTRCFLRVIPVPPAAPAPCNGPIEQPAEAEVTSQGNRPRIAAVLCKRPSGSGTAGCCRRRCPPQ
jgi:superfamily II DNA/RNA helicase